MASPLAAIARFEIATKLRRISTWVYFAVFAALAALWMAAAGGAFASANVIFSSDKVYVNSPYAIAQTVTFLGMLGTVVIAAFMGRAVQQDYETLAFPFFFTSPITRAQYLFGRFIGTTLVLMVIFVGIAAGVLLGSLMPGIDPTRVGPWSLAALVEPYFVMLLPNVIVLGAIFFALGALGRRMLPVYVAGVVTLIGYLIARRLLADIDNRTVAALIDPLGSTAMSVLTRYWSPDEKNTRLVPLANEVLWNRALWLAIGVAAFGACLVRFRLAYPNEEGGRTSRKKKAAGDALAAAEASAQGASRALPAAVIRGDTAAYARQLPGLVRLYLRETVKSPYFVAIVLTGALFILGNARVIGSIYGTNTYPVTYQVLEFASGTFGLFVLIVTAFYAGELVWRERDARVAQIADSLPTPTWLGFTAKLATLFAMQALLQVIVMACGIAIQLASGYTKLEPGQYLYRLFALQLPDFWMIAVLALTVHAVVNHKYLGHFVVVLYYVALIAAVSFGLQDRLYLFGDAPPVQYSDMNGYGHFVAAARWFQLYWTAACVVLLVVARLFWVRGTDTEWPSRVKLARSRMRLPVVAAALAGGVVFIATGAWIFYNTHVLNPYRDENRQEDVRAEYEKQLKAFATHPQPKVTGVRVAADIRPTAHEIRFRGEFTLKNRNAQPVTELLVNLPEEAEVHSLAGSIPLKLEDVRRELSWRRYSLAQPLAPDATMTISFDIEYAAHGFTNAGASKLVVDNGTFVNSQLLPTLGYQVNVELMLDRERKKHGLAPKDRMPALEAPGVRDRNYISSDGDWITFDTTVSTDPDQVALAPGYLQREWTENGRRYFHYAMDAPILDFYAFLSARYALKRDAWKGPQGEVPIEIYYQPGHEYDLDAMIAGVKDGLDYDSRNFSPYQHKQVRILEFPRYASFAQSFPNTIPFSEAIGFIAKVNPKDPKDIDYPYYVTAHEVAHQWWAHQVIGGFAQGATMLSETLAQYSALMVMKHKYGDAKMARFLKYELDAYLLGRGTERKREEPLYRNENQPYIHYRKGSLAMYALQDAIGEDAVNRALASLVKKWGFKGPPYPLSTDLVAELRAVTPPGQQGLVTDLFEKITLYENRAISATSRALPNGHFEVTLKASARKLYADENGAQKEAPMDELVDIGVTGAGDEPLYLRKHRVRTGESTFTIEVDRKPVKAGIDPVVKLVDRRPEDNTVAVN